MTEAKLPAPAPVVTAESKEFWEATAQGKLLLPKCQRCGTVFWYPRPICGDCGSMEIEYIQSLGRGSIYTYTVNRRGTGDVADYKTAGVFVLAYVQLEEGPCMLTNIVDCDPDTVRIGQAVEVVFHDTGQGNALPRFRPTAG